MELFSYYVSELWHLIPYVRYAKYPILGSAIKRLQTYLFVDA